MQGFKRIGKGAVAGILGGVAAVGVPGLASAASPATSHHPVAAAATGATPTGAADAVFVQTNDTTGNQVLAYSRSSTGTLSFAHAYGTGGRGGALQGAVVDKLASQGALTYDAGARLLLGVNAGSDTLFAFSVSGDRLTGRQVLSSHGGLPVSVAVHGDLVYVLDAGGRGAVAGYEVSGRSLSYIPGSWRSLGLTTGLTPAFLNSPGQVGFTPDGSQLIVTTKNNGSHIDVFHVFRNGRISASGVENGAAAAVPFGFVFDPHGRLIDAEASTGLSSYAVDSDGSLTHLSTVADNQHAPCWVTAADGYYFVANAGSASISAYTADANANLSLVGSTGVVATTDPGTIDLAASSDGQFLYAEAGGNGAIDEFQIGAGGSLTSVGSVTGLGGTGIEGIVAA